MPLFRGELVAVPYPFTDLTGSKTRPALVVSTDQYNRSCFDVLVAAVTTQLSRVTAFDHVLIDWRGAGLRYPSAVKGRVVTLAQKLVLRSVGRLGPVDQDAYDERLLTLLTTDASLRDIFLRRMLWTTLPGDRLQALAERVLEASVSAAVSDPRLDLKRLRNLLPAIP